MPGTPIKNKMIADIQKLGGDDALIERIAGGETITKIASELGISRPFLSGHLNRNPLLQQKLAVAKKARAESHADEMLRLADEVTADPNQINKAKNQIEVRKWLAGVDDPERYGSKAGGVQITVGALHLDALRKVQIELAEPNVIDGTATEENPDA
jgi:hypothetical protein